MTDAAVVETEETEVVEVEAETTEATEVESEDKATSTEESEPSESSTEEKTDKVQERIDQLTRNWRQSQREADELRTQLNEKPQPPKPLELGKTLEDFEYDTQAFTEYVVEQARQHANADVESNIQAQQTRNQEAQFLSQEREFSEQMPDYLAVTRNPALPITQDVFEAIQVSEKGPEVLYYLGKNPEQALSLAQMAPMAMARQIGVIEATKLIKPEPKTTETPAPTPKIEAKANPTTVNPSEPASDKLSQKEWLKRRNKQLRKKLDG